MVDEMDVDEPRLGEAMGAAGSESNSNIRENATENGMDVDQAAANEQEDDRANNNGPGRFGVPWQQRVNGNSCCRAVEKILKPSYKLSGGQQGQTGEAGMDGSGTTLKTHDMVVAIPPWDSLTDLGSGTGILGMHAALHHEGNVVGIEMSDRRLSTSLLDLRKLTIAVSCIFEPCVFHPRDSY